MNRTIPTLRWPARAKRDGEAQVWVSACGQFRVRYAQTVGGVKLDKPGGRRTRNTAGRPTRYVATYYAQRRGPDIVTASGIYIAWLNIKPCRTREAAQQACQNALVVQACVQAHAPAAPRKPR